MPPTTVLIVDSHPILCQALETLLQEVPDLVIRGTATTFEQAEEMVSELAPEVVILNEDLGMANAVSWIERQQLRSVAPAVVLLTSSEGSEDDDLASVKAIAAVVLREASLQDVVAAIRWAHLDDLWISPTLLSNLISQMRGRLRESREVHLSELTTREGEILELLVEGMSQRAIAIELNLSLNTVRTHTRNIQTKLNVHSNIEAVSVALDRGIRPN